MRRFEVNTRQRQQLIDITEDVARSIDTASASAVLVYIPHTTAGVFVNEHADPDVARDILLALDTIVPDGDMYLHAEGNSAAHAKATLVGTSQLIPLSEGRLSLGRWQGIFLAEFDGPRTRHILVSCIG